MASTAETSPDSVAGRWKSRYLGAVESQERLEREAGTRIGELGGLMVRLARTLPAAEAASLNRRLAALSGALKRRPLDPGLSHDMREVHDRVLDVMDACDRERAALHGALGEATGVLESACVSRTFKRQLKSFRRSLARREPPPASELVQSLSQLQSLAIDAAGARQDRSAATEPPQHPPPPPPAAAIAAERERAPPAVIAPANATAQSVDWQKVREVLADLVARVQVSEPFRAQMAKVTGSLEEDLNETRLLEVLESIRDLMDAALASITHEFQGFLDSVDRRLDSLLAALGRAREDGATALALEQDLAESFEASIAAMRTDAATTTRLDELKSSIDNHLVTLVNSVQAFSQGGDARERGRNASLTAMEERLRELESESRDARGQLDAQRKLARTDALTGLPNRKALDERLAEEIRQVAAGGMPPALALADIDHFKRVNDSYGHVAGDRALALFAGILSRRVRQSDFCARFGGEEFVLLFPGTGAATAAGVLEELRCFVEGCGFSYKGEPVPLTASFGITDLRPDDDVLSVLERADRALYAAKSGGRNRICRAE